MSEIGLANMLTCKTSYLIPQKFGISLHARIMKLSQVQRWMATGLIALCCNTAQQGTHPFVGRISESLGLFNSVLVLLVGLVVSRMIFGLGHI